MNQINLYLKKFISSNRQTKIFVFMVAIYGAALVLSTLYAYGRLEFVKNQPATPPVMAPLNPVK